MNNFSDSFSDISKKQKKLLNYYIFKICNFFTCVHSFIFLKKEETTINEINNFVFYSFSILSINPQYFFEVRFINVEISNRYSIWQNL